MVGIAVAEDDQIDLRCPDAFGRLPDPVPASAGTSVDKDRRGISLLRDPVQQQRISVTDVEKLHIKLSFGYVRHLLWARLGLCGLDTCAALA